MSKIKNFFISLLPSSEDKTSEKVRKIVFISAVVIFIIAGICLINFLIAQSQNKQLRDELADIYNSPVASESLPNPSQALTETDGSGNTVTVTAPLETIINDKGETEYIATVMTAPEINLSGVERLLAINPETVGWVQIPNTEINNVVVQSDDNYKYLDKSFYGANAKAGTIFADHRCVLDKDFQSDNIVLYGHNQHDGTMLGDLHNYKGNVWYYREHPTVNFNTNYASGTYKIFAYFVTNTRPEDDPDGVVFNYHDHISFSDEAAFNRYIGEIMKRNEITTNVDVKYGDKLLTLSTCSTEFAQSRFVVFARKLRDGESPSINMTGVQLNDNAVSVDLSSIYSASEGSTAADSSTVSRTDTASGTTSATEVATDPTVTSSEIASDTSASSVSDSTSAGQDSGSDNSDSDGTDETTDTTATSRKYL